MTGFNVHSNAHRSTSQCKLYLIQILHGTPTFRNQTLLRYIQVEHVKCVVNRLDLTNLDEPNLDVLGGCDKHAVTMVLGLTQYLQVEAKHMAKAAEACYTEGCYPSRCSNLIQWRPDNSHKNLRKICAN